MATISLGMIVRNEGRTLRNLLESVAPHVDQVVIGLAGESTDNTQEVINQYISDTSSQDKFFVTFIEWTENFAEARNHILERCPGDYFLWLDGDDVLVNGEKMREYIDQYPDVDAFYWGYDYARDEDGNITCFLMRERLVRRHRELPVDWKWIGEVHEVLSPQFHSLNMPVQDILVRHFKPADKHSPDRNLEILYRQLREQEPNPDPRILGYLGAENAGQNNLKEAIVHWQRFVKLSGWDEEKYQMQVRISHAWRALGKVDKALGAAYDAIQILPDWPDAYLSIAKSYISDPYRNYKAALGFLEIATSKPKPQTMLIVNPMEYTFEPALLVANCYVQLQDWELALHHYKMAYQIKADPDVARQIALLEKENEIQETTRAFLKVREFLGRHDEWLKVRRLFDAVPKYIEQHPAIQDVWGRSMAQTAHVDDPSVMEKFYTGNPHWAPMDEERILDPEWMKYPRLAFALSVANRIRAESIVDWGCSDGFISLPLARETGAAVHGVDLDPRCISLAAERASRLGINASFHIGNVERNTLLQEDGNKHDLALFFEVIEHVVDPSETLDKLEASAKHIAITTPYLAWENGQIPEWDKLEPKGHLRIFNLKDLEILLQRRGKIHNLYREPWGNSGWIFADYEVGVKHDKSVTIYAPGSLEAWGPKKLQREGLGGSETAAIRLGEELSALGYRAFIYNWSDEPGYYNGVCYREREQYNPSIPTDLLIAWRAPELADADVNCRKFVLWMHDTDAGDRLTPERAQKFDAIVVLTEWHKTFMMEKYPFIPETMYVVIGNGVDTSNFEENVPKRRNKVIYASSPDRGLDVILEGIWPKVTAAVPEAELHVYYGWETFDRAVAIPGYEFLQQFKNKLLNLFLNNKNVVQHGRVSQKQLAREMQEASIWLYPTYFTETYCIVAIEAQLAGALPITNRLAGLAETVVSGIDIPGDVRDPNVQEAYAQAVIQALKHYDPNMSSLIRQRVPAWSWTARALAWTNHFLEANRGGTEDSPSDTEVSGSNSGEPEEAVSHSV